MSDGPGPDDFRAKVFRDREHTGDWRVEKLDDDGESIEIAIFSGGDARQNNFGLTVTLTVHPCQFPISTAIGRINFIVSE
jgi:hypothetical protein